MKYIALLIGIQLADEIGVWHLEAYSDSKLIVNQVRGEYEVRHEHLVPYYNATIHMAESSKASTSTIYLDNRMHMQMHWHLLLLHWLFQLEQQRKYSSIVVTCTA